MTKARSYGNIPCCVNRDAQNERISMQGLPKILVVEDDIDCTCVYQDAMEGQATVLVAHNTEEAEALFQANPDIDGIMMDGDVPGQSTTEELVLKFKLSFSGPFVAATGGLMQERLLRAGCNLNLRKPIPYEKLMSFVQAAAAHRAQRPS